MGDIMKNTELKLIEIFETGEIYWVCEKHLIEFEHGACHQKLETREAGDNTCKYCEGEPDQPEHENQPSGLGFALLEV